MGQSTQIDTFSRFTQVSRETITSLVKYENYLIQSNKTLNLIGKSTINEIWTRHFLDSSQVIDFIDKNTKNLIDLGSGAGFPGVIIAILAKDRKISLKVKLIEKSPKKASFLREIVNYLNLNVEVLNINALTYTKKLEADLIVARAFKPLRIVLQFLDKNTENWKKVFLFLGKTGQSELLQASKSWDIKYKQRMSVTSNDSVVIEINKLKKKQIE
jgi:16S rRNA (guanine527-N7)-methyltransferase